MSRAASVAASATPHTASQPNCANVQLIRNAPTAFPLHTCAPNRVFARARIRHYRVDQCLVGHHRGAQSAVEQGCAENHRGDRPCAEAHCYPCGEHRAYRGKHHRTAPDAVRPPSRRARHQDARSTRDADEAGRGGPHAMERRQHGSGNGPESAVADAEHELERDCAPYGGLRPQEAAHRPQQVAIRGLGRGLRAGQARP